MTYFLTRAVQYHRRGCVSRSCSGREGVGPQRYGRQTIRDSGVRVQTETPDELGRRKGEEGGGWDWAHTRRGPGFFRHPEPEPQAQGYRIKPHGQLVRVSSTGHPASTARLSTSWSGTTLQGGLASGRSHLQASFPLRCFQRLSLPHVATRRYDWRHNRYTSGASTPVLSY